MFFFYLTPARLLPQNHFVLCVSPFWYHLLATGCTRCLGEGLINYMPPRVVVEYCAPGSAYKLKNQLPRICIWIPNSLWL
ncbi:hypothetical protein BDW71DRAFT_191748 [Aspergillus fruticulosus]